MQLTNIDDGTVLNASVDKLCLQRRQWKQEHQLIEDVTNVYQYIIDIAMSMFHVFDIAMSMFQGFVYRYALMNHYNGSLLGQCNMARVLK